LNRQIGTCSACGEPSIYWQPQKQWLHRNMAYDAHPVKHGVLTDPFLISKLVARQRAADVVEEALPPEIHEPKVRAHESGCWPWKIPGGANILGKAASNNGWVTHSLHFARGPLYHGTSGAFLRYVDSVVLRLDKDYRRVVASWEDGDFYSAWILNPLHKVNAKDLKAYVTDKTTNLED
jgi:hypothetical protein